MSDKVFTNLNWIPFFLFLGLGLLTGCGDPPQLSEDQLNGTIMLMNPKSGKPQDWMTLREYKSKLALQLLVENVEDHFSSDGKNFGVKIVFQSKNPSVICMFEPKEGKLHPSHIGNEGKVIRIQRQKDKVMAAAAIKASIGILK